MEPYLPFNHTNLDFTTESLTFLLVLKGEDETGAYTWRGFVRQKYDRSGWLITIQEKDEYSGDWIERRYSYVDGRYQADQHLHLSYISFIQ